MKWNSPLGKGGGGPKWETGNSLAFITTTQDYMYFLSS